MSRRVALFGSIGVRVVLALTLLLLGAVSAPALAVEEGGEIAPEEQGPAPGIDEIGTQNDISQKYKPEPAEPPPFMRFFYLPLVIGGFLIVGALLFSYLAWQPRFAEERRSKRRR